MHNSSLLHVFSSVLCTVVQTCILFAAPTLLVVFHLFDSSLNENSSYSCTVVGRLSDVLNAVIIFGFNLWFYTLLQNTHNLGIRWGLLDEDWLFIWKYWCNWFGLLALQIPCIFQVLSVPPHTGIKVKFPIDLAVVPGNTARISVSTSISPL